MLMENDLDHMTEEEAEEEIERMLKYQKPKPGILSLEGCWRSLIEISLVKDVDRNNRRDEETFYKLIFDLTENRCAFFNDEDTDNKPKHHRLSEAECWQIARASEQLGATGSFGSLSGTLIVPARNLPALVSRVAKVIKEVVNECLTCRHQTIVGKRDLELDILRDKRFQASLIGELYWDKKTVIYREGEFVSSITLMPNDDEGFNNLLEQAEEMDREAGHIPLEVQAEDKDRRGPLELGLKDHLYLARDYSIKTKLSSTYIREIISHPVRHVVIFGMNDELWSEDQNREVIYIIQVGRKEDRDIDNQVSNGPFFLDRWKF